MKTSAIAFGLAALVATVAADDVNSIAASIPKCQSSCISSIFTKQGCAQNDWKCFCTPKNGGVGPAIWAAGGTSQCQGSIKPGGNGCQTKDISDTSLDLGRICSIALGGGDIPTNLAGISSAIASNAAQVSADVASAGAAASTALAGLSSAPADATASGSAAPAGTSGASPASATGGSTTMATAASGSAAATGSGAASSASSRAAAAARGLTVESGLLAAVGAFVLGAMA